MDKDRISRRFDHASATYDQYAVVQKTAAQKLAKLIAAHWPDASSIYEIGCGTGNLTAQLIRSHPQAKIHATDISPAMLQQCQANLAIPIPPQCTVGFEAVDGEWAQVKGFDLVASSLTFQWFNDPFAACRRLRQQGADLAIATLVEGTFAEWKEAHAQLGLQDGVLPFLSASMTERLAHELGGTVEFETLSESFPSATDFVRSLKSIGANTPRSGYQPAPLGKVLRVFQQGITVSYRVAYLIVPPVHMRCLTNLS